MYNFRKCLFLGLVCCLLRETTAADASRRLEYNNSLRRTTTTTTTTNGPAPLSAQATNNTRSSDITTTSSLPQPRELTVPLSNFTLHLHHSTADAMDVVLLVQSIQDYFQVGFLWNIYNVTFSLAVSDDDDMYVFGPGSCVVQLDDMTMMNSEQVLQQEQESLLLNDMALLELVLQRDLQDPVLRVLAVHVEQSSSSSLNRKNRAFDSLSNAQWILLGCMTMMVCISLVLLTCLRHFRQRSFK